MKSLNIDFTLTSNSLACKTWAAALIGSAMMVISSPAMQIFVNFAPERISGFEVEPNDTILNLKVKIQDRNGFLPGDQFLYKAGILLEEDRILADYNILKESRLSIHVIDTLPVATFSPFSGGLEMPLRDATSGPGTGWMTLNYDGAVDLLTLSPGSRSISLFSYNGSGAGAMDLFDPAQSYSWTFLTSNTGVSGFDPDMFNVDTSHFMNPFSGTFSVVQNGSGSLAVAYAGVPEPSLPLLCVLAFASLAGRRRLHKI